MRERKCKAVAWLCVFFLTATDDTRAKSISHVSYVCLVWTKVGGCKNQESRAGNLRLRCVRSLTVWRRQRRWLRNKKRKTPFWFASQTHTTDFCFARHQIHYMKVYLGAGKREFEFRNTGKGSTLGEPTKTHTQKLCTCVRGKVWNFILVEELQRLCRSALFAVCALAKGGDIYFIHEISGFIETKALSPEAVIKISVAIRQFLSVCSSCVHKNPT